MSNDEEGREIELRKLQEIAQLSSVYYRNVNRFQRNVNLSHVVHACIHFSELICVVGIEIFHVVHHQVNLRMKEEDPNTPDLPEGRNPIFISYPICIAMSLTMAFMWLGFPSFRFIVEATLFTSATGVILMVMAGVIEMRHAEIYINLNLVTDEELIVHPVYIHNFVMCVITIFVMLIYLIHFWATLEYWRWRKKSREAPSDESSPGIQELAPIPETSREDDFDIDRLPPWDILKNKIADTEELDTEKVPVILYCCFIDCCQYYKERELRKPLNEFQVVHVK